MKFVTYVWCMHNRNQLFKRWIYNSKVDNFIHWINHYPVYSTIIGFPNTDSLDSDLSGG